MRTLSCLSYDLLQILWASWTFLSSFWNLAYLCHVYWNSKTSSTSPVMTPYFRSSSLALASGLHKAVGLELTKMFDVGYNIPQVPVLKNSWAYGHTLSTFATPDAQLDMVHINIIGLLSPSNGLTYLLICIDRFTRWPEAISITDIMAETVARAFVSSWIGRFGIPSTISTDRGRQFDSCLWNELMQLLGSKRIRTMTYMYHPSSNGLVGRFHQQLKASLKAHTDPSQSSEKLPLVLLGIRSAVKEDLHCIAAELVYSTTLCLTGEFFNSTGHTDTPDPATRIAQLKVSLQRLWGSPIRKQPQQKTYVSKDIVSITHVLVHHDAICKPLQLPYDGPYYVLKRANKHYTLDIAGRPEVVSLDRLKPGYLESDLVTDVDMSTQATSTVQPTVLTITCKKMSGPIVLT